MIVAQAVSADCSHGSLPGSASLQDNGSDADSIICQSFTQAVGDFFLMLMNVFRYRLGYAVTLKITSLRLDSPNYVAQSAHPGLLYMP